MNYQTIKVRLQDSICFLQFNRPEANNTINDLVIEEFNDVLDKYDDSFNVLVIEGSPEFFCFGADFKGIHDKVEDQEDGSQTDNNTSEPRYDLWMKLTTGSFITISHVKGKANAGGVGFVAASDIVLADETAVFSLSELLFGLFPACVMPFLIRRIGFQKAHYLTMMTQPVTVEQAHSWGLVDAYEAQSNTLLRKHLLRLKRLSKPAIKRYKKYMNELNSTIVQSKSLALSANYEMFSDPGTLEGIYWYVEKGQFPWERK